MPELDTGDTAWVLVASALVLFMTPGLAFFYGGMVRAKNVLAMLMQNFFAMGIVTVLWVLFGYSLAFGDLGNAGLHRQLRLRRPEGPRRTAIVGHDPDARVRRVPAHVRGHHAGADHRRDRRPHALGRRGSASSRCGRSSCTCRSRTGSSPAAGSPIGARSTSPAARSCTSTPVPVRSRSCCCSASGEAGPSEPMPPHSLAAHAARYRHPVVRLVRLQRRLGAWPPTASPRRRSSTRSSPRPRR